MFGGAILKFPNDIPKTLSLTEFKDYLADNKIINPANAFNLSNDINQTYIYYVKNFKILPIKISEIPKDLSRKDIVKLLVKKKINHEDIEAVIQLLVDSGYFKEESATESSGFEAWFQAFATNFGFQYDKPEPDYKPYFDPKYDNFYVVKVINNKFEDDNIYPSDKETIETMEKEGKDIYLYHDAKGYQFLYIYIKHHNFHDRVSEGNTFIKVSINMKVTLLYHYKIDFPDDDIKMKDTIKSSDLSFSYTISCTNFINIILKNFFIKYNQYSISKKCSLHIINKGIIIPTESFNKTLPNLTASDNIIPNNNKIFGYKEIIVYRRMGSDVELIDEKIYQSDIDTIKNGLPFSMYNDGKYKFYYIRIFDNYRNFLIYLKFGTRLTPTYFIVPLAPSSEDNVITRKIAEDITSEKLTYNVNFNCDRFIEELLVNFLSEKCNVVFSTDQGFLLSINIANLMF